MSIFSKLCTDIVDFGTRKSGGRTEKITKVTIHHMAGVMSGKDCAHMHLDDPMREASANYYIGNDGDICGGVSEDRRAWTSGSPWNDQKAITIEVSNSSEGEPWPVSDAAYTSAIKLAADICNRYGIVPKFTGDRNGTLTLHYMFQATQCPGTTWRARFESGRVERDIQALLKPSTTVESSTVALTTEQKIWKFLMSKIGNEFGVAGLMGNLFAESGLKTNNLQNSYERLLGMNDDQYTAAVDSGQYPKDNFVNDQAGYGLAQWTFWTRKLGLYELAKSKGRSIADLDIQLEFLWHELSNNYKGMLSDLTCAESIYDASTAVLTKFERPADQSINMKNTRTNYGKTIYNNNHSGQTVTPKPVNTSSVPFAVRIIADELNVRKGPGVQYDVVTTVKQKSAFTIVELSGSGEWGKLKSGAGWINLKYTERV